MIGIPIFLIVNSSMAGQKVEKQQKNTVIIPLIP